MGIVDTITTANKAFFSLHKVKKTLNANYIRFFLLNFLKNLCVNKRGTHEMRKFKDVDELVNELKPDYPVYCIRPESIKKSTKFFKDNFSGKIVLKHHERHPLSHMAAVDNQSGNTMTHIGLWIVIAACVTILFLLLISGLKSF